MAKPGRSEDRGETSLAAATAAIITARWGAPPRRATMPEPDRLAGDEWTTAGRASATATVPAPVGTVERPPPPPPPPPTPAFAERAPAPPLTAPQAPAEASAFAPPDYVAPGRTYAPPVEPAAAPAPEPYRGAVPPPMFTPAAAVAVADLFPAEPRSYPAVHTPEPPPPPPPTPPPPPIPTQRLGDSPLLGGLDLPVPPGNDDFAGSVMSGLAFPEPFIPEPYDPDVFSLPTYGSDGAASNGSGHGGDYGASAYLGNGGNGNGHASNGNASNGTGSNGSGPIGSGSNFNGPNGAGGEGGFSAFGAAPVREPELVRVGGGGRPLLPRRVPSIPDVPDMFLPNDPAADGFELTRIASFLRDDRLDATDDRPDGFDVAAVLEAVRRVPGVSQAQLRWNTGYGHTLRVEFVDGADEGEVTREVAGMLRQTMGLAAQPGPVGARLNTEENTLERVRRSAAMASGPAPVRAVRSDGSARVLVDHVQVTTLGVDAAVDVRLTVSGGATAGAVAKGSRQGPAVDAYLLRLAADAAADAVDQLLVSPATSEPRGRCFIEHVAVVPFGATEVAVVVVLLTQGSAAEQVSGSALVNGDPREAVVRATLSAANRRLEQLLA